MSRKDTRGHATETFRDREAGGQIPASWAVATFSNGDQNPGLSPRHGRSPRGVDARRPSRCSARRGYGIRASQYRTGTRHGQFGRPGVRPSIRSARSADRLSEAAESALRITFLRSAAWRPPSSLSAVTTEKPHQDVPFHSAPGSESAPRKPLQKRLPSVDLGNPRRQYPSPNLGVVKGGCSTMTRAEFELPEPTEKGNGNR